MENRIGRAQGYSFVELLFAVAIFSFIAFSIMLFILQLKQDQVRSANMISVDIFRRNLASVVIDSTSWQNTTKANSSSGLVIDGHTVQFGGAMDCLVNNTACSPGSRPFALLDSAGNLVYDGINQSAGVGYDGSLCASNCPFRFNLDWAPVCPPSGPCVVTQVRVQATLSINGGADVGPINPARYSLTPPVIRSAQ